MAFEDLALLLNILHSPCSICDISMAKRWEFHISFNTSTVKTVLSLQK